MNACLRLVMGALLGLSAAAAAADEPATAHHDAHVTISVSDSVDSDGGSISMSDKAVVVHVKGSADAHIDGKGDLSIDGKPVTVSEDGRTALVAYHDQARSMVNQGKAIGKEGIHFAFNTLGTVFSSLLTGDADQIDGRVEKKARKLRDQARALCSTLGTLRQAQDSVVASVPEFAPYGGVVTGKSVEDCEKDARDDGRQDSH